MHGSARKDVLFGAALVYTVTVPGPKWKSWLRFIGGAIRKRRVTSDRDGRVARGSGRAPDRSDKDCSVRRQTDRTTRVRPFQNRLPTDGFWAAKKVTAFSESDMYAIVRQAQFSDNYAEDLLRDYDQATRKDW